MKIIRKKSIVSLPKATGGISDTLNVTDKIKNAPSINLVQQMTGIPQDGIIQFDGDEIPEGYEEVDSDIVNSTEITDKENKTYSAEIIDGLIDITKVSISEILTMASGVTLLDGNIYKDRNRYFGNITVKKDSGNFKQDLEAVASFNKTIVTPEINTSCILAGDQYGSVYVTQCYMSRTAGIKVADWHNGTSGKYNHAKINLDVVTE